MIVFVHGDCSLHDRSVFVASEEQDVSRLYVASEFFLADAIFLNDVRCTLQKRGYLAR